MDDEDEGDTDDADPVAEADSDVAVDDNADDDDAVADSVAAVDDVVFLAVVVRLLLMAVIVDIVDARLDGYDRNDICTTKSGWNVDTMLKRTNLLLFCVRCMRVDTVYLGSMQLTIVQLSVSVK